MMILCNKCRWQGYFEETQNGCCPNCFQKLEGFAIIKLDF